MTDNTSKNQQNPKRQADLRELKQTTQHQLTDQRTRDARATDEIAAQDKMARSTLTALIRTAKRQND